jgi:hypothetical protein
MNTLRRLAPWMVLGPITGPLAEGVYRNACANNPVLASLYALAAFITWYDLTTYGTRALAALHQMIVL